MKEVLNAESHQEVLFALNILILDKVINLYNVIIHLVCQHPVYDCALALTDSERYDIILLQEPWTAIIKSRYLTKTHPAYDTFSPVDGWSNTSTRPRVMTYVRRDSGFVADQKRPFPSRDILWLTVNNTTIVNFYRQNDETDALDALIQCPIPGRCLMAGDFNAKHHTWQTGRSVVRGNDIAS